MKNDNTAKKINIDAILCLNTAKGGMVKVFDEYQTKPGAESKGKIFGLIESWNSAVINAEILDTLDKCLTSYLESGLPTDRGFDALVMELNARLRSLTEIFRERLNIVIGTAEANRILFSPSGNIAGYLTSVRGIKKITDNGDENSEAFFQSSFCGNFSDDYILYFCNKNFDDCFAPYNLDRAIKKYGAPATIKTIKEHIFHMPKISKAAAVFIYKTSSPQNTAKDSMAGLFESQNKTLNQISPSILAEIKMILSNKTAAGAMFRNLSGRAVRAAFLFLRFAAVLGIFLFYIISNFGGGREKQWQSLKMAVRRIKTRIRFKYRSLPSATKIILYLLLAALLSLGGGIFYSFNNKERERLYGAYIKSMESAEKLKNDAEAHLLFGEKRQAVKKLQEAVAALNSAPNKPRDKAFADLYLKLKTKLRDTLNILEISSPAALIDLSGKGKDLNGPLYILGDSLVLSTSAETIKIRLPQADIERHPLKINFSAAELSLWNEDDKKIYNLSPGGTIQIADLAQLTSELKEVVLESGEEPAGLRVWSGKAYILSYGGGRFSVWKHNPSLSGFGRPSIWISDKTPRETVPLSFGIDSNLYVLFSNNEIKKYYKGAAAEWNFDIQNMPQGTSYNKIIAGEHYGNLYLVGRQTISILSKNGDFLSHLVFPSLNIQNAAIDEKNKTLYILADKKIYAATVPLK